MWKREKIMRSWWIIIVYAVIFFLILKLLKNTKFPYVKFLTIVGAFALFVLIVLFLFV